MATKTIYGTGAVVDADFKNVKWVGKTKDGHDVEIALTNAINLGDIDWTFAEKNDTVPALTFTSAYTGDETDTTEPWTVKTDDATTAGKGEIVLGAGVFYIGSNQVALTRGGGSFKVVREFRRINADGDRGAVKGRVVCEGSEATLTLNALTFLTNLPDLYAATAVQSTATT